SYRPPARALPTRRSSDLAIPWCGGRQPAAAPGRRLIRMQDQQVEVVPGSHAVARVAGAVVLVVHRGAGRPTADSPAVRALVALRSEEHTSELQSRENLVC